MRKKQLSIPLWDRSLYLLVGGDWNYILKVAKELKLSFQTQEDIKKDAIVKDDRGAAYFCMIEGTGLIWFPKKKTDNATLAHEATHIADFVLQYIGAFEEMEARAYTVDWIVSTIPKELKKL